MLIIKTTFYLIEFHIIKLTFQMFKNKNLSSQIIKKKFIIWFKCFCNVPTYFMVHVFLLIKEILKKDPLVTMLL